VSELNIKQEAFCREYIVDLNATQAAIRAGYSEKTAHVQASRLLTLAKVQECISSLMGRRNDVVGVSADYVLRRLVEIDEMDVADILTDSGDIKPIKEWPKVWRTSLSAIDIHIINLGDMDAITKKVKWPDKLRNLELLGKHVNVNAFTKEEKTSTSDGLVDALASLIDKLPS
jgi:phage terminase small subunit